MTRINVLHPSFMPDQWVSAHLRESLRPINKYLDGGYKKQPIIGKYRLNKGHELWGAGQSLFTRKQWILYKEKYIKRGFSGFDFEPSNAFLMPDQFQNDYSPTKKDYFINIERLIERWNDRKPNYQYTIERSQIRDNNDFRDLIDALCEQHGVSIDFLNKLKNMVRSS